MSPELANGLTIANLVFTGLFTMEVTIKLIGSGRAGQILLATSRDDIGCNQRGFDMRWMSWPGIYALAEAYIACGVVGCNFTREQRIRNASR